MNVVLARIDDRLVHGQVTVGWRNRLRPDLILLANDTVADDPWQARIYAMSVPPEVAFSALTVAAAARALRGSAEDGRRVLLLTASAGDMRRLDDQGASLGRVNVGGMHYARGKRELIDGVYVDRNELDALRGLRERGVELIVQTVPGGPEVDLDLPQIDEMEARL